MQYVLVLSCLPLSLTGTGWWVIDGQHTISALQEIRQQRILSGIAPASLPAALRVASCSVVKSSSTVHERQLVAGAWQNKSGSFVPTKVSAILRLLAKDAAVDLGDERERVRAALAKSGSPRVGLKEKV